MPALIQVAQSAGPVCISYNLPDLKQPLKLSEATLSGIFLGTIKNWQDPKIKKDNPGANLSDLPIVLRIALTVAAPRTSLLLIFRS